MPPTCYSEILTQQPAWEEALRVTLSQRDNIAKFFRAAAPSETLFAGCTSPHYAGIAAADFWKLACGLLAAAYPSSELVLYPDVSYFNAKNPVLVALTRSGQTTETLWAVEEFEKRLPGRTVLITCNPRSPLAETAALTIALPEFNEATIPQTRSLGGFLLAAALTGAIAANQPAALDLLQTAPALASQVLAAAEPVIQNLFRQKPYRKIFFLGGGPLLAIARDGALKTMEMAATDALAFPFMESRHGPRSIIDEETLVVGLYSRGGRRYEAQVMSEYTANHHASTLAVVPEPGWETGQVTAVLPTGCPYPDAILGLSAMPIVQLVAYFQAMAKGLNPDQPRMHTQVVEIQRF